ncbi:MAG: trypsin-like peptidase domain-containing protein [Planctomycetota bacterium]
MRLAAPIAVGLALWLLGGLPAARVAVAQSVLQAAIERRGPVSPEKRAELISLLKSQAEILQAQTAVVKTVVKLVGPTVVHIEADVTGRTALQFGRSHQVEEAGSGVIVQFGEGYFVLTNRHLINGASAENIDVHLADGRLIHPARTWQDAETDVAVMAVSAPELVAASIGDSDSMDIGDFVLAVGSPFGLSHSVTYGMISAKGRRGLQLGKSGVRLQSFLQTDAAINPGNSGGPLVNLRGEVIGINTAIASNSGGSEGIGFSIPINMFAFVARQLVENGKVRRAFLGVNLDVNFGPAEATRLGLPRLVGARINGVRPQSPATAASLQEGDVILKVGNTLIEDDSHLVDVMQLTEVGTEVPLVIFRDRQELRVTLTAGDWEEFNSRG